MENICSNIAMKGGVRGTYTVEAHERSTVIRT